MATVAPAAEKTTDLLQKLSLDSKTKTHDAPVATKKHSAIPASDRSMTPVLQNIDPNMYYYSNGYTSPYYIGGHDGMSDWDDYSRYISHDGVEMTAYQGLYGDMYGYGYNPYGAYTSPASPVPTIGHDGQLYSPQQYQYPPPYFQPPSPAPYNPPNQNTTSKGEVGLTTSSALEQTSLPLDTSIVNANGVANGTAVVNNNVSVVTAQKPSQQNSSLTSTAPYNRGAAASSNGLSSFDGMRSPGHWFDTSTYNAFSSNVAHVNANSTAMGRNQNSRSFSNMGLQNQRPTSGMGPATSMIMNRMYPSNRLYNAYNTGLGFGSSFYDSRTNGRWGFVDNKYKPRGRGNGFYGYPSENLDGLSELNRGPRANRAKNPKGFAPTLTVASKGQNPSINGNTEDSSVAVPDKDQYNKEDFPVDYSDAKFFIIKSYSEDDLHKSVKYNVWASTPNGNKKLDNAYKEAQEKATACPIFLFFSVNTSGQFVGVAEMVGPVDFNKTVDYWQQDKWTGCFSVKWHIVKDVPNTILKHIILENNDNKPVTNSRDTQEVKLEQGLQLIKLFKEHVSKTSILDDFGFYETRQKVMQEKRAKQHQLHKQVVTVTPLAAAADDKNKDGENGKPRFPSTNETVTAPKKESNNVGLGDRKLTEENDATPLIESKVVTDGVGNGC